MVDPIGNRPGMTGPTRIAPVRTVAPSSPGTAALPGDRLETDAVGLRRSLAEAPPVDTERVAEIRKAIEKGEFPITPARIADRLLALKLNWNPNGAA